MESKNKMFVREEKYLVVKLADIDAALFPSEQETLKDLLLKVSNINPEHKDYVVVSSKNEDLYDYVWSNIEAQWLQDIGQYNHAIVKRAVIELEQLQLKISKLTKYMNSVHFTKLAPGTQQRLGFQLDAMNAYSAALSGRIQGDLRWLVEGLPVDLGNQKEE